MIPFTIAAFILAAFFASMHLLNRRLDRDGTWHDYGTNRMRRWTGDRFEYRPMTDEEQAEFNRIMGW